MTETRELVVTRTYTVADLIALLGEGKKNVKVKINMRDNLKPQWHCSQQQDMQILEIEIREKINDKTS